MNGSSLQKQVVFSPRRRRIPGLALGVATVMLVVAASLAAIALGAGGALTLTSSPNSKLGEQVVADAQGRTLYALSPETTHHLLCRSSECFKRWPPLTVHSSKTKLKAGPGVHGSLGILRRRDGKFQVTLQGKPLYRYSEDHAKGDANGQGIESFGGSWHVISATPSTSSTPPATTTTTPTTPSPAPNPSPGYGY